MSQLHVHCKHSNFVHLSSQYYGNLLHCQCQTKRCVFNGLNCTPLALWHAVREIDCSFCISTPDIGLFVIDKNKHNLILRSSLNEYVFFTFLSRKLALIQTSRSISIDKLFNSILSRRMSLNSLEPTTGKVYCLGQ